MNCECNPPKLAVIKVSQKENSAGKQYFTCPNRECKFFVWAGAHMPASISGVFMQKKSSNYNSYQLVSNRSRSPPKSGRPDDVKVLVHEVIEGHPIEIWLSMQCPSNPVIEDMFKRLGPTKCKFKNELRMWTFNFEVYDKVVSEFTTPPFHGLHLQELPKFLANGFSNYLRRLRKLALGPTPQINLDDKILGVLLPYQLEAVRFVVRRGGRALLGDEMGKSVP
jgi:hypothetical protein